MLHMARHSRITISIIIINPITLFLMNPIALFSLPWKERGTDRERGGGGGEGKQLGRSGWSKYNS